MKTEKTALITGINGQDGSYLAELLLSKGHRVIGSTHDTACKYGDNIAHLRDRVELRYINLSENASIMKALTEGKPDEVYNFAAQSYVDFSWEIPEITASVTGTAAVKFLEAIRMTNPKIKFYQASSSEIFAGNDSAPFDENTPIHPRTPYGCAKAFAQHITRCYRERYGMFAVSGILFNHESPRRGRDFLTRKVARTVAEISRGKATELRIGRTDIRRDWGYAPDYVDAVHRMMLQEVPRDFVIGTGKSHSVEELVRAACAVAQVDYDKHVISDKKFFRPVDSLEVRANPAAAMKALSWQPQTSFEEMMRIMVQAELDKL